ncbi:MAG: VanZ family protein [Saprospiraceae bacterium]|nr:VanZ family protein [Saprospiraceae bacterium]
MPIFVCYIHIILVGALWPKISRHYQTGEISLGIIPKEGDNFKMVNVPDVYRMEDGKRRKYISDTSFFNYPENMPFDTPYEDGGILICDKSVVLTIPIGDFMPFQKGDVAKKYIKQSIQEQILNVFSSIDKAFHFLAYCFFAILFLIILSNYTNWAFINKVLFLLFFGTLFGASIEFLQYAYIPGRDKEILDIIINSIGMLAGVILYHIQHKRFSADAL